LISAIVSAKSENFDITSITIASMAPRAPSIGHGVRRTRSPRRQKPATCSIRGGLRPPRGSAT
jgi:hypothetical protein